jgi:hypothetical protein
MIEIIGATDADPVTQKGADPGERASNVGEWRTAHPLRDVANLYKKAS